MSIETEETVMSRFLKAIASALLFAACVAPASNAIASQEIATKAGCMMCHAVDKKLVGPSFKDIAAKYKADSAAPAALAANVRAGSKGVWGPAPMMAIDASKISDADLEAVIGWILGQ
jgi:cytochrome c